MKKVFMLLLMISIFVFSAAASAAASYNQGVEAMNSGNYQAAIESFKAAAIADPGHLESRLGLANAYFKTNDWANAEIALKEAVAISPDNPIALNMLSKSLYMQKKFSDSVTLLERLNTVKPEAETYALLGKAYYNLKDYAKSAPALEKAVELGHKNTSDFRRLANAYYKLYKSQKNGAMFASAISILDKAAEIAPEADTFYYKGKFLYFKKKYDGAVEALKKAAELKPDDNTFYYLSNSLFKLKNYEEALDFGKRLLGMKKSSKAYALLGDIARDAGDNTAALDYYKAGAAYSDKKGQYCAQYYKYMQSQNK